ncbi:MAG: two-component regulator propeller domain-containing protein [Bacteroidia bacterium]|nr:two-component regulator propeller domain-containing protein [Bacteroidia bacterium]
MGAAGDLPDQQIRCLLEDRAGFLWIGTENGLCRYDGRLFLQYSATEGPDRLAGNVITDLIQDREGIIWAASLDGGLTRIDPSMPEGLQTRRFFHIPGDSTTLPVNRLRSLFDFDESYLMISGEQAPVLFLHKRSFQCYAWTGKFPIHPSNVRLSHALAQGWCHSLLPYGPNGLIINFLHLHQVYWIDTRTGYLKAGYMPPPRVSQVQTFTYTAPQGAYFYSGGWGPYLFAWKASYPSSQLMLRTPDSLTVMLWLDSTRMLAGLANRGLCIIEPGARRSDLLEPVSVTGDPLQIRQVNDLLLDRRGTIWIAASYGLYRMEPAVQSNSGILDENARPGRVFSMEAGGDDAVRVFCSRGIYEKLPGESRFTLRQFSYAGVLLQPTTWLRLNSRQVLLGTESGLYEYDPAAGQVQPLIRAPAWHPYDQYAMNHMQIRSICTTGEGRDLKILLGVLGYGLVIVQPATRELRQLLTTPGCSPCLQNNLITKMIRSRQGVFWLAAARGLYRWDAAPGTAENRFTAFLHQPGAAGTLSNDDIQDLYEDEEGVLWIGTRNGLCALRQDSIRCFSIPWSRGSLVRSIVPLDRGRLLLLTPGGPGIFDCRSGLAQRVAAGPQSGLEPEWLQGQRMPDGSILLCAANRWMQIRRDALTAGPSLPVPYAARIRVNGLPQTGGAPLRLGFRDVLIVQISSLGLHSGSLTQLEYRWEGMSGPWQPVPPDGNILIANPSAGRRSLAARVRGLDGSTGPAFELLSIRVSPPFWRSWWFISLLAGLAALAAAGLYRYRLSQLARRQEIRVRIAADLHDEVGSALSSIAMGSELAGTFIDQQAGQARSLMEQVRSTAIQTLENMSDILWALHPRHDAGGTIVRKMQQIQQELLLPAGISAGFQIAPAFEALSISMDARKNLMLIYKEALHNAVKHAQAAQVQIRLLIRSQHLLLEIEDNGTGLPPGHPAHGYGLESMRRRAADLGGTLELLPAPGGGLLLRARLPLRRLRD